MAGQTVRMGTMTAITPTTLMVMEKNELLRVPIQSISYPLGMHCTCAYTGNKYANASS